MSIVEELRSKVSRDNRELLDRAVAEIEDLERNLEAAYKKVEDQHEEICRLHSHIRSLERSRDNWKDKADRLGKQSEGEWLTDKYGMERSVCSLCHATYEGDSGNYCPNCGAKMKQN